MAATFIDAVIDTLLPGVTEANGVTAPPASAVGIWPLVESERNLRIMAAIAQAAGGEEAFRTGTDDFRIRILKRIEATNAPDFGAFVTAVLTRYYEHPQVISAFGWPSRPPQPEGHEMPEFDEKLLDPVKARGEIWRKE